MGAFMKKIGFTCGAFDILHPGYIELFKDAKSKCDFLRVGLQSDPSIDRPEKCKPIQSLEERFIILSSIKYIDDIMIYHTEEDLYKLLKDRKPDIRINGSDWEGKKFTGYDLGIPQYFHQRTHNWSATDLRKRIYEAEKEIRNTK